MEFFNETVIMLVMYAIFCFSDFVPDPETKSYIGLYCCAIVSLHLLVNLYLLVKEVVHENLHQLRLY